MRYPILCALLSLLPLATPAVAGPLPDQAAARSAVPVPAPVVTWHRGTFGGQAIGYTATVEGLDVTSGAKRSTARVVSFAYTRDGTDPKTRPVMFLFNGGPIVASSYLHIGGLGPRRIAFPDDVTQGATGAHLIDNTDSPLDAMDLVFVDPASTGFSRVTGATRVKDYFSVPEDAAQFGAFIRTWLAAKGRTGAPVYILGESYGTNRAAAIAGQLAQGPDPLPLAGVVLFGQAVNIIEYSQRPGNIISYVASLPTLAAIGWHHDRVDRRGRSFDQFLADARTFAQTDYLTALYQGDRLGAADRDRVAARLQEFSGIPADWYRANALRITKERYRIELLRDRGLLLGRNDARYTAPVTGAGNGPDPSDVLGDAINRTFASYIREELKVGETAPYIGIADVDGLGDWGWGFGTTPFGDWPYQKGLTDMMALNPRFRLMVGNGYHDTQTTIGAAEYLVTQNGWDPKRVTLREYQGGHMAYTVAASARALGDDLRALVR